jgi:KAP family P-loop domain
VIAAESKVRELEQKLDEIKSGRSLAKFLLERVQTEDYRKHLGIISLIRKDFERLDELLGRGDEGLDKIGRIILYIDDLDRCPADKVVEVLQAIYLLLAMPLFVAVVGVDLRWLLHSLDQQYSAFHSQQGTDGHSMRPEWITSPQSYLEKIFQIPFNLRPMDAVGYGKLISSLLPAARENSSHGVTSQPLPQESGNERTPSVEKFSPIAAIDFKSPPSTRDSTETRTPTGAPGGTDRDLNPAALIIRDWEREFAARLFPFIPSPRAAKRFTNVYRILKAPLTRELTLFEGTAASPGEFQAAMLLLGVVTCRPREAVELFAEIMTSTKSTKSWREIFISCLSLTLDQRTLLDDVKLPNIEPFVRWAPVVARFTFEAAKSITMRPRSPGTLGVEADQISG